ncbi:MAG: hypothetical protein M1824_001045 [Vezdaea acicularis]|nr:MAG: hypothetical protein M1824_001045 [Vezdaea acicularis]
MATVNMSTAIRKEIFLAHIWQASLSQLTAENMEIALPTSVRDCLGPDGMNTIVDKFSTLINHPVVVFHDLIMDAIRLGPEPTAPTQSELVTVNASASELMQPAANAQSPAKSRKAGKVGKGGKKSPKVIKKKEVKIRRPPNAFILYRKHHHYLIKESRPAMPNNDISVLVAQQWREEAEETKDQFRALADEVKSQHLKDHPGYQYTPRKPCEKKRRISRKKADTHAQQELFDLLTSTPMNVTTGSNEVTQESSFQPFDDGAINGLPLYTGDTNDWLSQTSGMSSFNLPQHPAHLADLLEDYNDTRPLQASQATNPPDSSPIEYATVPSEEADDDDDFYATLVDWEAIEGEQEEKEHYLESAYHSMMDSADEILRRL